MTITREFKGLTVGELKSLLADLDDNIEIEPYNIRGIGFDSVEIEIIKYLNADIKDEVYLNVETYSAY